MTKIVKTALIVDTSIWIDYLKNNPDIFIIMQPMLEERLIYSAECIFGELLQGTRSLREKNIIIGYRDCVPKLDEKNIFIEAGIYSGDKRLIEKGIGLIDCIIICLAKKNNLRIWTLDKKLKDVLDQDLVFKP